MPEAEAAQSLSHDVGFWAQGLKKIDDLVPVALGSATHLGGGAVTPGGVGCLTF